MRRLRDDRRKAAGALGGDEIRRNATRKSAPDAQMGSLCSLHLVLRRRRVTKCCVQLDDVAAA
jgi:hypothetical protein